MFLQQLLCSALFASKIWASSGSHKHTHGHGKGHGKGHKNGTSGYEPGVFDYIFVGSGPGGAPAACRLARAGFHVLLIEAGMDTSGFLDTQIASFHPRASELPEQLWVRLQFGKFVRSGLTHSLRPTLFPDSQMAPIKRETRSSSTRYPMALSTVAPLTLGHLPLMETGPTPFQTGDSTQDPIRLPERSRWACTTLEVALWAEVLR